MKVEAVQISNFRSVSNCELNDCSGFNVLIGKNNSGKSNILSSISAFFSAVREGTLVSLAPTIDKEVDFFNSNSADPAEVTLTFRMTSEERQALVAGITNDFPQLTNAVISLDPASRLRVLVRFYLKPSVYTCVSRISLVSRNLANGSPSDSESIILDVSQEAALKLNETYRQYQQAETRIRGLRDSLQSMDRDDWSRMRLHLSEDTPSFRRPPSPGRRFSPDQATFQMLETMVQDSDTYDEFQNALRAEINASVRYAENFDRHGLDQETVETFSGRGPAVPEHVVSILRGLSEVKVLNVTDERRPMGRGEAQRLLNMKTRRGGQEPLSRIQGVVSTLLGVQIDAFSGEQTNRQGSPMAELDVDNFVVEVNGSGIKEALRLLLDIEFEEPSLLIVEEPEIHLHPGLETALMRHLEEVSKTRQVFITTHSTNFLDTVAVQNIYLVSKDTSTTAQLLDRSEAEELVPAELGIRLSSLFIYDRLVFVESQSDEDIIRAWANTLGVSLDQSNVGFIHMGGSRNLSYFAGGSTLSFLAKRRVKMWVLIDRDEKDEEDIDKLKQGLGEDVHTSVFNKREIENYLIHAKVLAETIEYKLKESGSQGATLPTIEEIKELIGKSAESLKKITILKRVAKTVCQPLYPDRGQLFEHIGEMTIEKRMEEQIESWTTRLSALSSLITTETERQTSEIESRWQGQSLDIVPGDLLIDKVFSHYGLRFLKNRGDGVEIARRMSQDEIGPELEQLIRGMAT